MPQQPSVSALEKEVTVQDAAPVSGNRPARQEWFIDTSPPLAQSRCGSDYARSPALNMDTDWPL
jgi:hypothetical protein